MHAVLKRPSGPKAEAVKIEGDWESAMAEALKAKRPKGGWPDKPPKAKAKRKKA